MMDENVQGHRITMRQIVDIKADGKWIEFWFSDGMRDPFNYDECCKAYMFNDLLAQFDLSEHAWKYGRIGLWVEWSKESDRPTAVRTKLSV